MGGRAHLVGIDLSERHLGGLCSVVNSMDEEQAGDLLVGTCACGGYLGGESKNFVCSNKSMPRPGH